MDRQPSMFKRWACRVRRLRKFARDVCRPKGRGLGRLFSSLHEIDAKKPQIQVSSFTDHQHNERKLQTTEPLTHRQLFETILRKIEDGPQAVRFHSILQNLAHLDLTNPKSDNVWEALDSVSSEATESGFSYHKKQVQTQNCTVCTQTEAEDDRLVNHHMKQYQLSPPKPEVSSLAPPLPPPPPPLPPLSVPLVTSSSITSALSVHSSSSLADSCSEQGNQVPPPPPIPNNTTIETTMSCRIPSGYFTCPAKLSSSVDSGSLQTLIKEKCNTIPLPKRKMRTLHWTKIPSSFVGESVWSEKQFIASNLTVDFKQLEELFCQKKINVKQPKSSLRSPSTPANKVTFLETKRNLAVNIYLKQFKGGGNPVIDAIKKLKGVHIGADKLRALLPLLPTETELTSIKSYSGDLKCLGDAETFYLQLSKIPSFALRIRVMLLEEEFFSRTYEFKEKLDAVTDACKKLMTNENLKEFLSLVLHLGNYINAGSYAGNAAGFSLSTLPQLLQIKTNVPRLTFLHYVLAVAESNNKELQQFTAELRNMKEMARISLESLQEEAIKIIDEVKYVELHLKEDETGIRTQFTDFLKNALDHSAELQQAIKNAKAASHALAKHYCEEPKTFEPEACFSLIADILNMIERAQLGSEEKRKTVETKIKDEKQRNKATGRRAMFSPGQQYTAAELLLKDICSKNFKLRQIEA